MAGWNLKEGDCLNLNATERELWAAINHFMQSAHKTTTYKFCFFKSLLDLLTDNAEGSLSFTAIFCRFTEIYWELITKYGLSQAHANSRYTASKVEVIIDEFISIHSIVSGTPFHFVRNDWQEQLVKKVEKTCSNYVVGAFYTSTDCLLYGFSKKEHRIYMSSAAVAFCLSHLSILEELNYYHWAKMLEKINGDSTPRALVTKMSQIGNMAAAGRYSLDDLPLAAGSNQRYSLADIIPWNY